MKFDNKGLAYAEDVLTRTYQSGFSQSDMVGMSLHNLRRTRYPDGPEYFFIIQVLVMEQLEEYPRASTTPRILPIMSIYLSDPQQDGRNRENHP
jgi:hypothetical protein